MSDRVSVLIVDDEPLNRLVIGRLVRSVGGVATLAESAEQALDRAGEQQFAAVITDIQMPGMDGLELIRRLRTLPGYGGGDEATSRIVALTGFDDEQVRREAAEAGADLVLAKPLARDQVERIIRSGTARL